MAQSLREAFVEAVQKNEDTQAALKKRILNDGLDYTEIGMRFLKECLSRETVYGVYQGDWYNHLAHGVPRGILKSYEHYHLGGMVVIRKADTFHLIDWKCRNDMLTEILEEFPTETPNLLNATFLATYNL